MSPFEELRNGETLGFKKAQDIGLPRIDKKYMNQMKYLNQVRRIKRHGQGSNKIFVV